MKYISYALKKNLFHLQNFAIHLSWNDAYPDESSYVTIDGSESYRELEKDKNYYFHECKFYNQRENGAIYAKVDENIKIFVEECLFVGCYSQYEGGSIYIEGGNFIQKKNSISKSTCSKSQAIFSKINNECNNFFMESVVFECNNGNAIYIISMNGGYQIINSCNITNNKLSADYGIQVFESFQTAFYKLTNLVSNNVTRNCIWAFNLTDLLEVTDSYFYDNCCVSGALINCTLTNIMIYRCCIHNNKYNFWFTIDDGYSASIFDTYVDKNIYEGNFVIYDEYSDSKFIHTPLKKYLQISKQQNIYTHFNRRR